MYLLLEWHEHNPFLQLQVVLVGADLVVLEALLASTQTRAGVIRQQAVTRQG